MHKFHPNQVRVVISGLLIAAGVAGIAQAGTPIVVEQPKAQTESTAATIPTTHRTMFNVADLLAMLPGESFSIYIPGHGAAFEIVFDRVDAASPLFAPTWIGHLKGYTDEFRTIITASAGHTVGRISTPEGNFHIKTINGVTTLTDLDRAGLKLHTFGDDTLPILRNKYIAAVAPPRVKAGAEAAASEADAATNSTIDVLVLYDQTFAAATGNPQNAIANLIATANTAMSDSIVAVTFRLVATQLLDMSDADSNETLLYKVTYPSDQQFVAANPDYEPDSTLIYDPVYSGVPALRDKYGADLVVSIRQFNEPVQVSCGIAWTLTDIASNAGVTQDAPYAYAVVSYGEYQLADGSGYVCDPVTMAHEMGHNMGSAHDYAHVPRDSNGNIQMPVFPYSFGYGLAAGAGVPGFATVMAANYIQAPIVAKYSSPNLTCGGYVCGVSGTDPTTAADNVMSLNNTRTMVAQFRPTAAASANVPATGYWWNPAEPGRGYNIEQQGTNLFMAAFLYDTSGRPTWYGVGPGAMTGNTYTGTLETFAGGQTLTGAFQAAKAGPSAGNFSITFTSPTQAMIAWPGGTVPIQRFDIVTGGSSLTPPSGTPQAGWWWAPTQGGRGYAIEIQGGSMFLAGYMYDVNGNPIWYASGPTPMSGLLYYSGTWVEFGAGQTLTGTYQPASVVNSDVGSVTIQFTSTTTGTLTFPNGSQVSIQRFAF